MNKFTTYLLSFLVLAGLAVTASWWLPGFLGFVSKNSSTIQGLEAFIQIVLMILTGILAILGIKQYRIFRESQSYTRIPKSEINSGTIEVNKIRIQNNSINISHSTSSSLKLGRYPPVPNLIIGRDDDLLALKRLIGIASTKRKQKTIQVLTAVRGWPGVGKSSMLAVLAHDREIKKAFPDGVLWTSLDLNPDLFLHLDRWGRTLGINDLLKATNLEEAVTKLGTVLSNKRMFLIVDDIWEIEHVAPFQKICGKECTLLIATRKTEIAEELASPDTIYNLPVLTEKYAIFLLRKLAPKVVEKYPSESKKLVQSLEYLPLALQVAGRLLHSDSKIHSDVSSLLNELQDGAKIVESKAPADRIDLTTGTRPIVAALFQKSTDCLDKDVRKCFAKLGVFSPKPASFDWQALAAIWKVKDPSPIVSKLVNHGLLEPVAERFQMHALLNAHAKLLFKKMN